MINLSDDNKKMIYLGLKKYFSKEFDYLTLNQFEKDIYGKKVNLIMDGELYSDSLLQDDALNITVNGALFKFINKGINIHYIYSAFGNEIFIKNLLSNIVNNTIGTNKINILSLQSNKLTIRLKIHNKLLYKIDKLKLENSKNSIDIINLLIYNHENKFMKMKKCHRHKLESILNFKHVSNYEWYTIFKKQYKMVLTSGILCLLHLLKLRCDVYVNGFNFNLISGHYHTMDYYKYTPEQHFRTSMDSLTLNHLNNKERHIKGIEQDKYVLYLLLNYFFKDNLHFQKEINEKYSNYHKNEYMFYNNNLNDFTK